MRLVRYHRDGGSINRGEPEAAEAAPIQPTATICPRLKRVYADWRDLQSAIAFRMASGARLLHLILYSGMPPSASATASSEICAASSMDLPRTISVAMDEQAIATAHPMHLNLTSLTIPCSMRSVIKTVSLSTGLFTIALPEGSAMLPTLRGAA